MAAEIGVPSVQGVQLGSLGSTTRGMISDYRHEKVISCVVAWLTETGDITVAVQGKMGQGFLHEEFLKHVSERLKVGKKPTKTAKLQIIEK
jgi:hypothetical protein